MEIFEDPIYTSSALLLFLTLVVVSLSLHLWINNFDDFYREILAEAHGTLFDIAIIGIFLVWINKTRERKQMIRTYRDEIDDFRLWESEEAAFRTVGNIKRLNRNKIYEINLVNCYLSKTNLNYVNLKNSNLNNVNLSNSNVLEVNFEGVRLNQANLENANMNQAILSNAYASGANFKDAFLIKAVMKNAFLIKANFANAYLMEADLSGAYLNGADFTEANLYKADLRGASGLTIDQLRVAKSLYLTEMEEDLKNELAKYHPELLGNQS